MRNKLQWSLITLFTLIQLVAFGQHEKQMNSAEIQQAIKKLGVLGSALYVAAHPDDENTRLISYLANEEKVNTAYLSLTRGDGGQNLIGPEISELLGVIRTQELLAARRTDGGKQMFTRANDFGYSKTPEETKRIWNKDEVLADVVWAIRKHRPDVIVNRFSHDSGRRTHGHHTASAQLSYEAFDLAGDPNAFPEQLKWVEPWQPRRLFFNTSWWFYGSREKFDEADKSKMISVDIGTYYPLLGKSNSEIAAESRSMHKCQGFGSAGSRGSQLEYCELLKGDMPEEPTSLFTDIDITWNRVENGEEIAEVARLLDKYFDPTQPHKSMPGLLRMYSMVDTLQDQYWRNKKLTEIENIIQAVLGLYLEASATQSSAIPGEEITLNIEVANRSPYNIRLRNVYYAPTQGEQNPDRLIMNNQVYQWERSITLPDDIPTTDPYWLKQPWELGMYHVPDPRMIGLPESPRYVQVIFEFEMEFKEDKETKSKVISFTRPVIYKYVDPAKGEVKEPFEIMPPIFVNPQQSVMVFPDTLEKELQVLIRAGKDNINGTVELELPELWTAVPDSMPFSLKTKGEEALYSFKIYPPDTISSGNIDISVILEDSSVYDKSLTEIRYDHITPQMVLRPASVKVSKLDIVRMGQRIGYIMGAGDKVPESLEEIGYEVDLLEDDELSFDDLSQYDAIIAGVRAYNTREKLKFAQSRLNEYVENGGVYIVQYNTNRRLVTEDIAPYILKLSRYRVTDENAPVQILEEKHVLVNYPNKITSEDFDGWVQERGLYFAGEWSKSFMPILAMNDPGEDSLRGSLLAMKYGEGFYIYTGLSLFRQLPAGVPGAYRLIANFIALSQLNRP